MFTTNFSPHSQVRMPANKGADLPTYYELLEATIQHV
jgi:hypothetical protein